MDIKIKQCDICGTRCESTSSEYWNMQSVVFEFNDESMFNPDGTIKYKDVCMECSRKLRVAVKACIYELSKE